MDFYYFVLFALFVDHYLQRLSLMSHQREKYNHLCALAAAGGGG
jgi:hypothetical protein